MGPQIPPIVMAGLVPAVHLFFCGASLSNKTWMPAGMTREDGDSGQLDCTLEPRSPSHRFASTRRAGGATP